MKTPKRDYKQPKYAMFDLEPDWFEDYYQQQETRWKRKNRIKQLKRTINRYRDCTNLPFYCQELHAYKLLQELRKPSKKATDSDWDFYIKSLRTIQNLLSEAILQAERGKTIPKITYKLVETKSFYHIKRVCGGKETSCHRYDKRSTTKEEAQRITDIRNREEQEK